MLEIRHVKRSLECQLLATNTNTLDVTAEKLVTSRLPKTQNHQIKNNIAMTSKSGFSLGNMTDHLKYINKA